MIRIRSWLAWFYRLLPRYVSSRAPIWWIHRIDPLPLPEDIPAFLQRLRNIVSAMPRTRILESGDLHLWALCSTRMGFRDDLVFRVAPDEGVVHVQSASRTAISDLGVNRRRVERVRRQLGQEISHTQRAPRRPSARAALAIVLLAAAACDSSGAPLDPATPPAPPAPAAIAIASGGNQRALPARTLHHPVVVRVLDAGGQPLAGQVITLAPGPGHGTVESSTDTTDAAGEVAARWTLGDSPGRHALIVTASTGATGANPLSDTTWATAVNLEAELDSIFQPPTEAERDAVRADWAGRDISARDVREEMTGPLDLAGTPSTLRVVSHSVGGVRHYGGIIVPESATGRAAASMPILAYLHGGDGGVTVADLRVAALALGPLRDSFVYVIPSFRGESFVHGDSVWMSEGPNSPWNYDVDDALALINVAIATTPVARGDSINLLGGSRGAGVALLAGVRDARIARIVALFGPTWFFDDWVRNIVERAALGNPPALPGVAHLDSTVVQPHIRGETSRSAMRLELVRRSSALFADDLPSVQLHHGEIDQVVAVSQAYAMIDAMEAAGRTAPEFEAFIYGGANHNLLSLVEAIPRTIRFLARAFQPQAEGSEGSAARTAQDAAPAATSFPRPGPSADRSGDSGGDGPTRRSVPAGEATDHRRPDPRAPPGS